MAEGIIVTGTGRSGTTYMAELLGIGHEHTFTTEGISHPIRSDASVFAHRYIDMPWARSWYIIHAVREPTACIASLAAGPVFAMSRPQRLQKFREWNEAMWPEVYGQPSPVKRAAWWYYVVNRYIEDFADERVRVEAIVPEMVERWAGILGSQIRPKLQRLFELPRDVNARPNVPKPVVAWSDLPPEVQDMAERYGYTP